MKFNKSCILLIAIAIFLLISIGSVCASDNLTDNSDSPLADDGTDVVLSNDSDTGENVPDDTDTEKINTTVETDKSSYEYKEDSNKTFTVEVKDNKSKNNINVDKNNFIIYNGDKNISFDYNNSMITITEKLSTGKYNFTINYLGNGTYYNSSKIIAVKIYGNNTIETETSVVCDGKNIEIPVKISDQVDEIVDRAQEHYNLTLVYTNETGSVCNLTITEFTIDENGTIRFNTAENNLNNKLINASLIIKYINATDNKTVAIKVSTKIEAETVKEDNKFKSEEIKDISITIKDGQENQLNINKADLKIFDNGKEMKSTDFEFENSNLTLKLDIGVHNLTIIYNGNVTYASNETNIVLKVWGNQTIDPQKSADIDSNGNVNITLNLSDGADPVDVNLNNVTATLFWKINNQTYNETIEGITLADDKQTIIFKVNKPFESAYVDIKYNAENNLTGKTTIKVDTNITAPDNKKTGVGEVINFTVEVKSVNGTAINVTSDNIKILNNGKEVKFTCNNSVITITDKFTYGIYDLTINYLGTDTYANSTKIMALTVYGINATTSTNINSTKKGEVKVDVINGNTTININKDDLKLNVTYKNGNDTIVIKINEDYKLENGTLYFTLENGNFTTATLTIEYGNTTFNVTLNRIYNAKIEAICLENEYLTGNFTFKLIDIDTNEPIANKTVSFETDNYFTDVVGSITSSNPAKGSAISDSDGILKFANSKIFALNYGLDGTVINLKYHYMDAGKYNVTLKPGDNLKFDAFKTNITINKANLIITPTKFSEYYGTDKKYSIKVTSAATGEVLPNILLKLVLPQLSTTTYYLNTNSEGIAEIGGLSNLMSGEYKVVISNNDTKNINNISKEDTITINKIPVVINGKDVTVLYNTGTTYTIKVTDKQTGKAVANVYVLVQIDKDSKKTYIFQTNSKGQISFSASLAVGKHKISVSSADNRYDASAITKTITVKKASAKITAKKVTAYYKGGKYLTVKLTNTKNKKAIYDAKINIKIYISKNRYYNYNGNTGMNGQLKLLLDSLKPGTYKVVVSGADSKNFKASKITTKIVIKKAPAKFIAKKVTAKKGKSKYFKVTLKNKKTKKVITGIKIKVKVFTGKKAKTYTLKTNSKGIAKLNVKKLKVGKHKVVISSANKYVVAKQKKSTIKIKK
ncbi:MAG: hypothetical protein IJ258_11515 [Methanobrevibacter sp.]|uniref:hypothetical protein n=1 Tax=Methanobrevibacter sp. TaxID=66852 RepID=UPI0025FB0E68|nr:hypothetical protein [Methanobrevibacter sp.]MBQ8018706.1 hypothetical protein [Methanobrevibacter sp.]